MEMNYGKHQGESVESIMLKNPGYIHWMLTSNPKEYYIKEAAKYAARLIEVFDKVPIQATCCSPDCGNTADVFMVYNSGLSDMRWICVSCLERRRDEFGRFCVVTTFKSAINCVENFFNSRTKKREFAELVKALAVGKGLPKKARRVDIFRFFAYEEPPAPVKPDLKEYFFGDE